MKRSNFLLTLFAPILLFFRKKDERVWSEEIIFDRNDYTIIGPTPGYENHIEVECEIDGVLKIAKSTDGGKTWYAEDGTVSDFVTITCDEKIRVGPYLELPRVKST